MSNKHHFKSSTAIHSCDYDEEKNELHISFSSGDTHAYECSKDIYEGLKKAESPGKYFHQHVRSFKNRKLS